MSFAEEGLLAELSQRLDVMRVQEVNHYTVPDCLAADWQQRLNDASELGSNDTNDGVDSSLSFSDVVSSSQINELWREKICEWYYQIVDHYEFNREIVSISMSYLDRFLATRSVNRRIFQLAAMTALYIAIKLYENGNFAISSVTSLSRGYFVAEHIVAMEEIMLKALKWHVHPPTPIAFCRDFMLLISMDISPEIRFEINELVGYLTELSVCDYWFVSRKPSTIAIAAFVCAFEVLGYQRIESRYQDDFLQRLVDNGNNTASDEDIDECCDRLRDIFRTNAANNDEEAEETSETRVAVVTPDRELNVAAPRAKRAESPNSVIIMNQSRSRKRKVLSSVRFQAESADSNFNENDDEQADDLSQR